MKQKLLLLLCLLTMPFVSALGDEYTDAQGVKYTLNDDTYRVSGYTDDCAGDVIIPETVTYDGKEYSVTSIGSHAFYGCSGLTSITIPNSVTSIGDFAFRACRGLASIIIPSNVTSIGLDAFYNTSWYNNQPDGIVYAGKLLYKYKGTMPDGTKLEIKDGTLGITMSAFSGCSGLASVTIPNSVTSIGGNAFYNCSGLTSVTIPNSVTSIEGYAFYGCSSLTSVTIPASVTSIGSDAFTFCGELTSIIVEEGNTVYDSRNNCNAIIETESNTLIRGCKNTVIPNSVTSIGSNSFLHCNGMTSVIIPASVSYISIDAFTPMSLTEVYCFAKDVPDAPSYINGDGIEIGLSFILYNAIVYVPEGSVDAYKASSWGGCKEILPIAESASITIGGKGLTTYTSKYNLDFSGFGDEVKAYVATGYDYDTKTIWLTRVKDVPAGTALMVKGAAGKTYEVPVKETSGSYYKNMFVGNTTGSDMVLSETSDGMTNYYLKDGEFKSVKTSANIVDGKSYLQIPTAAPTAKAGSSQTMTMNAYGFASYCGSQDLDFTDVEGLKAYAATGYDDATGIIWLTRVMRVSAGTPLLLMGAPSTEDKVSSYTVPSSAVSSYYTNMLKGNTGTEDLIINTTEGDMTNYYLKGNQLLKVSGTANIHPGKAYMQIPTRHVTRAEEDEVSGVPFYNIGEEPEVISMQIGTRGIDGDDADTTGISEVMVTDQEPDVYYNLQGQRVGNPGKGLYIKNGKKVIVR